MASLQHRIRRAEEQSHSTLAIGRTAILAEAQGLLDLAASIDQQFVDAVDAILATQQRVIVTGIGKSGHIGRKIAATLAATGTPAFFLHASEAAHGDLGMITSGDLLLVLSNSGISRELRPLLAYAQRQDVPVVGIVSNLNSPLAIASQIVLHLPSAPEACPVKIAPTTSTAMMLAVGDALALAVMQRRGLTRDDIVQRHPGGEIGARLAAVGEIVTLNDPLPLVSWNAPMRDVVLEMSSGGKGVTGVLSDDGTLIGVITDGDLRRAFDQVLTARAIDIMTREPVTIPADMAVQDALQIMHNLKITVLFVTAANNPARPVGIAHIHDLSR